jgi:hypothetical protein
MAERRIANASDFTSAIRSNSGAILGDLATNPGSTAAEVASSTSINQIIVDQVLAFGVKAGVIIARANFSGIIRFWRANDWFEMMLDHISTARTWLSGVGSNGALEGNLASALVTAGVSTNESEALATALANVLINEGAGETAG